MQTLAVNNTRQSFAKVPGLMIWENDGTGIQVGIATRGLSPNRSWEFNNRQNGYDISADPFGYPEAYYTPAFEALEGVEFVRGAASLQFGPQFGGLVNYRFKKPNALKPISIESYQTAGTYGVFNSYTSLSGTKGKWGYMGFFNHRNADGWRKTRATTTTRATVQFITRLMIR
ncbi:MAG: TonB-dependent receptor plug domain-containing protein [Sphingobacteriales bacterium JAD_PAG50586_3]|nr:MAG: TonB-dependent receptor plug domain-containing protein [Sphingobacteriales bacterium JAD_PAG50586_3]